MRNFFTFLTAFFLAVFTLQAQCDAVDIGTAPIIEDFEASPSTPQCWTPYVSNTYSQAKVSFDKGSVNNQVFDFDVQNNGICMLSTPEITTLTPLRVHFSIRNRRDYPIVEVGTLSNRADPATFTAAAAVNYTDKWMGKTVYLTLGSDQYIAFRVAANGGSVGAVFIDDVSVTVAPDCPEPTLLSFISSTTTTATIGWQENGSATSWEAEYGLEGFTPGSGTTLTTVSTNPLELMGLKGSARYQVYLRANCGAGSYSEWSEPLTFDTECASIDLPLAEDFSGSLVFPPCWTPAITGSGMVQVVSDFGPSSGEQALLLQTNGGYAMVSIPTLTQAVNTVQVRFRAFLPSGLPVMDPVPLSVGTSADPADPSTFTAVENISYNEGQEDFIVFFNTYAGSDTHVSFRLGDGMQRRDILLDDIEVTVIPSCPEPSKLQTLSVTTTTATLQWQENGTATAWDVEYGKYGFEKGTGTVVAAAARPFELTGLTPGTSYQFYLRANCGGDDHSQWSTGASFDTECAPLTAPFEEQFDAKPELPLCWVAANENMGVDDYAATSAPHSLYLYGSSSGGPAPVLEPAMVSLPELADDIATLRVRFNVKGEYDGDEFEVGTVTDPSDPATFTPWRTITVAGRWTAQTVYFTDYAGSDVRIAFRVSVESEFSIDDVIVEPIPTCAEPYDLAVVTKGTDFADVSWTQEGTTSLWNVEWGEKGFTPGVGEGTAANGLTAASHTLTNLMGETYYEFYVQADCGSETSAWGGPYAFALSVKGDNCNNAFNLKTLSAPFAGSTIDAENDFDFCFMEQANDLIFYRDVADGASISIWQVNNNYDSTHALRYGGSCPGDTEIDCIDDEDTDPVSWTNNTGATQRVWFILAGYEQSKGDFTLDWLYTPVNYTISATSADGMQGSVTGAGDYAEDVEVELTASPQAGYQFVNWTVDGIEVSTDAVYTFVATEDITLVANFDLASAIGDEQVEGLRVYPNPTTGLLNINVTEQATVQVYDISEKQVLNQPLVNGQLDVRHLAKGIYILKIVRAQQVDTLKFILQ